MPESQASTATSAFSSETRFVLGHVAETVSALTEVGAIAQRLDAMAMSIVMNRVNGSLHDREVRKYLVDATAIATTAMLEVLSSGTR